MIDFSRFRQSAALPYRSHKGRQQVLLITSLGTRSWIVPKGNVPPGLTAWESAEFEALEEAGVVGVISRVSIGSFTYRKDDKLGSDMCRAKVFPLEVEDTLEIYPQAGKRERRCMHPDKALAHVANPSLRKVISIFVTPGRRRTVF